MVRANAVWQRILAGYNFLSWDEVFRAADSCGRLHRERIGNGMATAPSMISVSLSIDASELERDLKRIESGELELPTVSVVKICCDGVEEDFLICLPEP